MSQILRQSMRIKKKPVKYTDNHSGADNSWRDAARSGSMNNMPSKEQRQEKVYQLQEKAYTHYAIESLARTDEDVLMAGDDKDDSLATKNNLLSSIESRSGYAPCCDANERKSFAKVKHNLPSPIDDNDRDDVFKDIVWFFNYSSMYLEKNSYESYRDTTLPSFDSLESQLQHVREKIMPRLKWELETMDLKRERYFDANIETIDLHTRDSLVQTGALFLLAGAHLVKMASTDEDDEYENSGNHHLYKLLMNRNKVVCSMCGHANCFNEEGTDPNLCSM